MDVVRSEGRAEGKTLPFRLLLGPDAVQIVRAKAEKLLETCNEWESLASNTNYDA